jgi:hypothetical protein
MIIFLSVISILNTIGLILLYWGVQRALNVMSTDMNTAINILDQNIQALDNGILLEYEENNNEKH